MIIKLDFPDFTLSPNRKNGKHWTSTKKAKDNRYQCAYYATKQALVAFKLPANTNTLKIIFIEPDKRRRDIDNCLSSVKSDIDGICAALGIDDKIFDTVILSRGYCKGLGQMIVELS